MTPARFCRARERAQALAAAGRGDYVRSLMSTQPGPDSPPVPLSRWRARLAGPRGARKRDALLAADHPAEAVAALPVTEIYQIIAEIGLDEALELVAYATPEQLRGCIDIEAWDRDQLEVEALKPWLAALIEAGPDKVGEVWETLDGELTALMFQRLTRIYDLSLGEEPDEPDDQAVVETPDTYFAIALPEDEHSAALIHRLLDHLYRADPSGALARHTLMAARSEPPAELEEMSYRWRSGRMSDLGYVEFYEALEAFRPLDPKRVAIGEDTADRFPGNDDDGDDASDGSTMPVAVVEGVVGTSFLARSLEAIADPDELTRIERALMVLVNKVLAAARVSPGDREALTEGARHVAATVALGLESLTQGNLDHAAAALKTVSLTRLHRLGHTLTLRLARMARALAPRAATAAGPDAAMMAALLGRRPWFPTALDREPGAEARSGDAEIRPFESLDDLRQVAEALTRLALRVAIVDALGVDLIAVANQPPPRPALDDHIRTALVRAALDEPLSRTPLRPIDVVKLLREGFADGRLTASARTRAARALDEALARAQVNAGQQLIPALLEVWFDDIDQRLGGLSPDSRPDPRFLSGFVWTAQSVGD